MDKPPEASSNKPRDCSSQSFYGDHNNKQTNCMIAQMWGGQNNDKFGGCLVTCNNFASQYQTH